MNIVESVLTLGWEVELVDLVLSFLHMNDRQTIESLSHSSEHNHIPELLTQRGKLHLASGFQLYLRKIPKVQKLESGK